MSILTEALERISTWLENNRPTTASKLQQNLPQTEIERIAATFPHNLPREVKELYQWKNGSGDRNGYSENAFIFDAWGFVPLQDLPLPGTIDINIELEIYLSSFNNNPPIYSLDIFFGPESYLQGFIFLNNQGKIMWIGLGDRIDGEWSSIEYYISLESMMLTVAEVYENAYFPNPKGTIIRNEEKAKEIWHKYNDSPLPATTLQQIIQNPTLEQIQEIVTQAHVYRNPIVEEHLRQILQNILQTSDDSKIREIAMESLKESYLWMQYWKAQPLTPLSNMVKNEIGLDIDNETYEQYFDFIYSYAEDIKRITIFLLYMLKAVDPLIQALKRDDTGWRRESAWALGEIKNPKAMQPLIEALGDQDCEVRHNAGEALIKIAYEFPDIYKTISF